MESLSPTERDIGNGSNPAETSNHSLQQQNPLAEHSSQRQSGDGSESNSLVTDSLSTLSIRAEPFKSTSFDQSAATQLSVFAKEFVPKAFPTTSYTESYQTYVVCKIVVSKFFKCW